MTAFKLRTGLTAFALLALAPALPAVAQDIDRITGTTSPGGGFRAPDGVKVVAPGALVFASFDRNADGRIVVAEIEVGAVDAFRAADRSGDGVITGFEQTDWANSIGSATDVMANAMTFDIDLDRAVTQAEFTTGLKRIAGQIQPNGELTFADLMRPLNRSAEQAEQGPGLGWGTITGRGSPPGGGGRNITSAAGD